MEHLTHHTQEGKTMAQSTSTDIRHAIVAANGQLMEAFSRGAAASAAAAYTEQGQVLPPITTGGVYVNYLDQEVDEGAERLKAAYGPEKY
jgi:hypothetical protein